MRPTTLRLDEGTLDDLDSEYGEYGYSDRSEYIRAIIQHRDPPYEDAPTTADYGRPTTADYERLRDRVDELERRLDELPSPATAGAETVADARDSDGATAHEELPEPVDVDSHPHGQAVERAVQWAKEHEPVQRAEVIAAFEDEVSITGDSFWKHHVRGALKDAGFECDKSGGRPTWAR